MCGRRAIDCGGGQENGKKVPQIPMHALVLSSNRIRGSRGLGGRDCIANALAHPLDPLRARGPRREGIAEVLGLTGNLAVSKLHDTHRVGRHAVVCQDEFSDPKVASAEYAPHAKALLVRLRGTRRLNIAPAADPLAGLRILEHGIVVVNLVLGLEIIGVRGRPVAIQSRANGLVFIHCLRRDLLAAEPKSRPLFVKQRLPVCRHPFGWSGRRLIQRMRVRSGKLRAGEGFLCTIVVKPPLARLETRDNRVTRSGEMFRCMLTWRTITTADVTALRASAQMKPPSARA